MMTSLQYNLILFSQTDLGLGQYSVSHTLLNKRVHLSSTESFHIVAHVNDGACSVGVAIPVTDQMLPCAL